MSSISNVSPGIEGFPIDLSGHNKVATLQQIAKSIFAVVASIVAVLLAPVIVGFITISMLVMITAGHILPKSQANHPA